MVVAMTACTGTTTVTPTQTPFEPAGGTLVVGVVDGGDSIDFCAMTFCGGPFDPHSGASLTTTEIFRCCLARTLLSYAGTSVAEGGATIQPDLARSLPEASADGLSWTFRLRAGLRYAPPLEDTEIVAADVVRSITRTVTPSTSDARWFYPGLIGGYLADAYLRGDIAGAEAYANGEAEQISGLEAPDAHTLVIRTTTPIGDLPFRIAWSGLIPIPANPEQPDEPLGTAQGHDGDYGRFFVASGPYMVEGAEAIDLSAEPHLAEPLAGDRLRSLTLVRNPSWRAESDPLRPASPDRIAFVSVPPGGERAAVEEGRVHLVVNALTAQPPGRGVLTSPGDSHRFLTLNLAQPPFDDTHVRLAVNRAIDRVALQEAARSAGIDNDPVMHIALDSLEGNLLFDYEPWPDDGDREGAREEMRASSYDRDGDGRCDGQACEVTLTMRPRDDRQFEWHFAVAALIADDLAAIGLDIRVDPDPGFFDTYGAPEAPLEMRLDGWVKDFPSAATFFPPLFGSGAIGAVNDSMMGATPEILRRYHYDPTTAIPSADDRIESCQQELIVAQPECWAKVDRYLVEELGAAVPLLADTYSWRTSDTLTSITVDASISSPTPAFDHAVIDLSAPIEVTDDTVADPVPIPDGFYRTEVTPEEILAAGGPDDPGFLADVSGTVTMWIADGRFEWHIRSEEPHGAPTLVGTATGDDHRVSFAVLAPGVFPFAVEDLAWSLDGDSLMVRMPDCDGVVVDPAELAYVCGGMRAQFEDPWERVA
jgi:peptide/nickel transport system substrate-binding protein